MGWWVSPMARRSRPWAAIAPTVGRYSSGALPAGLSLSTAGTISGTPTTAETASFTVQVTSASLSGTASLSITITSAPTVTTSSLPGGTVGVAYSQTLAATGGDGSYSWTISSGVLPAGLSLSAAGTISGTPTAAGAATFTVQVTSAGLSGTASLTITVAAQLDISGVWTSTLDGTVIHNEDGTGQTTSLTFTLVQSGSVVTGSHDFTDSLSRSGSSTVSGTFTGGSLSLTFADFDPQCGGRTLTSTATVTSTTAGSTMTMTVSGSANGSCTATTGTLIYTKQ